nr:MAG TPA: hypothetical protein [Caudoviricetes sp.]
MVKPMKSSANFFFTNLCKTILYTFLNKDPYHGRN